MFINKAFNIILINFKSVSEGILLLSLLFILLLLSSSLFSSSLLSS